MWCNKGRRYIKTNKPAFSFGIVQCTMNDQPRSKEEENQQAEEPKSDTELRPGKGREKS